MTLSLLIAVATLIALSAMSIMTGYKLAGRRVLPMQWGLDGRPTWSAPRKVALAFIPALAAAILTLVMFPTITGPRTTGAWYCSLVIVICTIFVAVHGAYLGILSRPIPALSPIGRNTLRH